MIALARAVERQLKKEIRHDNLSKKNTTKSERLRQQDTGYGQPALSGRRQQLPLALKSASLPVGSRWQQRQFRSLRMDTIRPDTFLPDYLLSTLKFISFFTDALIIIQSTKDEVTKSYAYKQTLTEGAPPTRPQICDIEGRRTRECEISRILPFA
jgi:hypothetical protein